MTSLRHKLSHLLGWNLGRVVTFWLDDVLWVGFKCDECGEINGAHATDRVRLSYLDSPRFQMPVRPESPFKISSAEET